MRLKVVALLVVFAAACGDDTGSVPFDGADTGTTIGDTGESGSDASFDAVTAQGCETATPTGRSVSGQIYIDVDESERSLWDGGAFAGPDSPVAGVTVRLIGGDETLQTSTCDDGTFAFSELVDDTFFARVEWPEGALCRTRNCARDFSAALERGRVKVVTVGDSVPKVGDAPYFPARFADMVAPVAEVENVNIAVPGTVSEDWVPGTSNFDDRLAPHIASADVVVVSIGGNDFLEYANGAFSNPQEAIAGFPDFVREVMGRVLWIKDEVELRNPDADLVYLLYPDYSQSDTWADQFGFALSVIQPLVHDALEQLLDELEMEEDIVLVDFYGYYRETGLDLDNYLFDMLHFNDAGQQVYAEQLFEALGGVRLTGADATAELRFGMAP